MRLLTQHGAFRFDAWSKMKQGDFLLAGREAQAAIQARLREFQKGRHKHMHRARVIVPARVAALLAAEAQLVAPAVEAFHYRDVDDMRAARRMQHFPPQASCHQWQHLKATSLSVLHPSQGVWPIVRLLMLAPVCCISHSVKCIAVIDAGGEYYTF